MLILAETDSFARALGAAGLALSVVVTIIAALGYRRDRPKLKVTQSVSSVPAPIGVPHDSVLTVTVANVGRRPVSIADVSLRSWGANRPLWKVRLVTRWPFLRRPLRVPATLSSASPSEPIETPIVLQPAEARQFEFPKDAATVELMKEHDEHQFVSVVDILGREIRQMASVLSRVVSLSDNEIRVG